MRRIPRALAASAVALAVAASALAQSPPATKPAASIPLTRYFPKDGLLSYVEALGLDAQADAWGKTAAAKILNDTPAGAMLEDLANQALSAQHAKAGNPLATGTGPEVVAVLKQAFKVGFASGSYLDAKAKGTNVTVFHGALRPESKAVFAQFIKGLTPAGGKVQTVAKPGNRKIAIVTKADGSPAANWWVENKEDLVVADAPDAVIAALDGKAPSLDDDPIRADMLKAENGFQPLGIAWVDVERWPSNAELNTGAGKFFGMIDVKGVKRVEARFGTRDQALMHEVRIVAPSPRTGTMALFDGPKLDLKALPPIPEGVVEFGVFTIEPAKLWNQALALVKAANPGGPNKLEEAEAAVKARTKLRLKEDILGRLGPKLAVYAAPQGKAGGLGFQVPKMAILVEMKDPKAVGNLVDQLMIVANKEIKAQMAPPLPPAEPGAPKSARRPAPAPSPEFRVTQANPKTYQLNLPTQFAAMTNLRLTVAVGKKYLAIGSMPDAAKEALAGEAKPSTKGPNEEVARAIEGLPEGLTMLVVSDPRDTLPEGLAKLPETLNTLMAAPGVAPGPAPGDPPPRGGRPGASPGGGGRPGVSPGGGGGGDGPPPLLNDMNLLQNPPAGPATAIRVDPAKIPSAEAIRPLLFPGASAMVVDDQSIRYVARYAFPNFVDMLGAFAASRNLPALMNGGPGMPPAPGGGPARPGGPPGGDAPGGRLGGARPD